MRTRECANNGVLPPFETAWPVVFYAAERSWGGKQIISRELFPQRFTMRYFGVHNNLDRQSRIWAGIDGMMPEGQTSIEMERSLPAGCYLARLLVDGREADHAKLIILP